MKLSEKDKTDLDKFIRLFAVKTAHAIIQSRMGEKINTECIPNQQNIEWFNLNISELPEVVQEAKKVLSTEPLTTNSPFCIEISLRTAEGDQMVLEDWCLGLLPEQCDPSAPSDRMVSTIYNRMAILLKSVVSVTRVIPAYRVSRKQGPDTYIMCYRFHTDEIPLHLLGDGYKQKVVGQICTPVGTLQLKVLYRTKMTISPTQTNRDNSIMVKSDHFDSKPDEKASDPKEGIQKHGRSPIRQLSYSFLAYQDVWNSCEEIPEEYTVSKLEFACIYCEMFKTPHRFLSNKIGSSKHESVLTSSYADVPICRPKNKIFAEFT